MLYKWKALTSDGVIADSGHALGKTAGDAERIARMCVGGPLVDEVVTYLVEPITSYEAPHAQGMAN